MRKYLKGLFLGVVATMGIAAMATTYYYGWNPSTLLETSHGTLVDGSGGAPVIAQSGQTISAQAGGAQDGTWVATGATTGAGTLTFPVAVPTGRYCIFQDITTVADHLVQTTATNGVTVVTVAGTIASGDQTIYHCGAN